MPNPPDPVAAVEDLCSKLVGVNGITQVELRTGGLRPLIVIWVASEEQRGAARNAAFSALPDRKSVMLTCQVENTNKAVAESHRVVSLSHPPFSCHGFGISPMERRGGHARFVNIVYATLAEVTALLDALDALHDRSTIADLVITAPTGGVPLLYFLANRYCYARWGKPSSCLDQAQLGECLRRFHLIPSFKTQRGAEYGQCGLEDTLAGWPHAKAFLVDTAFSGTGIGAMKTALRQRLPCPAPALATIVGLWDMERWNRANVPKDREVFGAACPTTLNWIGVPRLLTEDISGAIGYRFNADSGMLEARNEAGVLLLEADEGKGCVISTATLAGVLADMNHHRERFLEIMQPTKYIDAAVRELFKTTESLDGGIGAAVNAFLTRKTDTTSFELFQRIRKNSPNKLGLLRLELKPDAADPFLEALYQSQLDQLRSTHTIHLSEDVYGDGECSSPIQHDPR